MSEVTSPHPISAEFADAFGLNPSDCFSLTEMRNIVWAYVKKNKLQNPDNLRVILCDSLLFKLLRPESVDLMYMLLP